MELADVDMQKPYQEKSGGPIRINLKKETNVELVQDVIINVDEPADDAFAPLATSSVPIPKPEPPCDIVYFSTGEDPIEITNKNPIALTNCSTYNADLNKIGLFWDMLVVHHKGEYKRDAILEAFYKVAGNNEFFPVAYRCSRLSDIFFLRLCNVALGRLFKNNLKLQMTNQKSIDITVKFQVASYKTGQLQVRSKFLKVLKNRAKNLIKFNGLNNVLSLNNLAKDPEMEEVEFNLGSNAVFSMLTTLMAHYQTELFANVTGLLLADNGLRQMSVVKMLSTQNLQLVDISNNKIDHVSKLAGLEKLNFTQLIVTGNTFERDPGYVKYIRKNFPKVITVNGTKIVTHNINPFAVLSLNKDCTQSQTTPPKTPTVETPQPVSKPTMPTKPIIQAIPLQKLMQIPTPPKTKNIRPLDAMIQTYTESTIQQPVSTSATQTASIAAATTNSCQSSSGERNLLLEKDVSAMAGGPLAISGTLITSNDCQSSAFFRKYRQSEMWHRVVVNHRGAHSKPDILVNLRKMLSTTDMLPCYYMEYPKFDTFLVFNAFESLEQLVSDKLLLRMNHNVHCPLQLHMNFAQFKKNLHVDPFEEIRNVIGKCFSVVDKKLDVSDFSSHPEFTHIEFGLNNPTTMSHVLITAARRYFGDVSTVCLANNGLETTLGTRPLTWMTQLTKIDLSNNKLPDLKSLEALPALPLVSEINLRGNPLGLNNIDPSEYIGVLKKQFPELVCLDEKLLSENANIVTQQNYLCSIEGYDLIDQFVTMFFESMDAPMKKNLQNVYLRNAILTISCSTSGNEFIDKQLRKFSMRSRNLFKIGCKPGSQLPTYIGGEAICNLWQSLGRTEHDFPSFTIDMTYFSESMVVLTVNGLFREFEVQPGVDNLPLGFVRTFVLRKLKGAQGMFGFSQQFQISNEQVLIYRPSMLQLKHAFKPGHKITLPVEEEVTQEDKDGLLIMFQELSNLVPTWCIRFLEQASWKFKNALELFVHLWEDGQVPDGAFLEYSQK